MKVVHAVVNANSLKARLDWLRDCFKGETVFVVGSGESLRGFDFARLNGQKVIALNHSYMDHSTGAPSALFHRDILLALDEDFFRKAYARGHTAADFADRVLAGPASNQKSDGTIFRFWTRSDFVSDETWRFYSPALSGLCGINAALLSGARKIVLLGFDCQGAHFYDTNTKRSARYVAAAKRFAAFDKFKNRIVNACPTSAISTFAKCELSAVLP